MIFRELKNIRNEKRDNPKVVSLLFISSNRLEMDFSMEPTDTIQFQNEKYQLKYVEIDEKKLGFEDLQTNHLEKFIKEAEN